MKRSFRPWCLAMLIPLLLTACEDKELEAESRDQQARIAELQAEVDLLTARLGPEDPGDPAEDLVHVKGQVAEAEKRVASLQTELVALTGELEKAEKEFQDYKQKYPIPE